MGPDAFINDVALKLLNRAEATKMSDQINDRMRL